MLMPGRQFSLGSYRFGFNGKENDNEVKGGGNQQDYGMRIYDPRLGKFLSVDPISKEYPFYSPYHFAGNTPIQAVDLDGLEPGYTITEKSEGREFEKPVFKFLSSDVIQGRIPQNADFGTPIRPVNDQRSVLQKMDDLGTKLKGKTDDPTTRPFTSVDAQANLNYTLLGTKTEYYVGAHSESENGIEFVANKETKMALGEGSLASFEGKASFTFNINVSSEENLPTAEPTGQIGPLFIQLNINKSGLQSFEIGIKNGEPGAEVTLEQTKKTEPIILDECR